MSRQKARARDEDNPIAFVIMPFDHSLDLVYLKVIRPLLKEHGYEPLRGDECSEHGIIVEQVKNLINEASLVVCDLTNRNPNVFYELGIADTLGKKSILITQQIVDMPFDVQHVRAIPYTENDNGLLDLREQLAKTLASLPRRNRKSGHHGPASEIAASPNELDNQRAALFSSSDNYKRWALKYLGDSKDEDSFRQIAEIAQQESESVDVRRDAFTAIYKISREKAFPLLLVRGLRFQKEHLIRERVVELLADERPGVKVEHIYDGAPKTLLDQLIRQAGDSSWGVRRTVCEVLGRWRDPKAIGKLREMLHDSEAQVSLGAVEALSKYQDQQLGPNRLRIHQETSAAVDRATSELDDQSPR